MVKAAGGGLILLASVGLAVTLGAELREHIRLLYEIRQMLLDIAQEAGYCLLPMEEILENRLHPQNEILSRFCKTLGSTLREKGGCDGTILWQQEMERYQKKLQLDAAEREVLEHAGRAFFGKNTEENASNLAMCLERLDYIIEEKRGEQKEKKRVAQTVSIMGGLMLIILLI